MNGHQKSASSQAAWALLTEGVTKARVEVHRLQHMMTRVMELVDASPAKDHLYEVAGDVISGAPARMDALNLALDRTGLALSKMGVEFLDSRLPLSDKTMVDEAVASAFGGGGSRRSIEDRVTKRYLAERG